MMIQAQKYNRYEKLITNSSLFSVMNVYGEMDNVYDLIIVLNYNMQPIIFNKGSAIL